MVKEECTLYNVKCIISNEEWIMDNEIVLD